MTVLDFVGKYIGQRATAPGGIGGECVDLSNLYLLEMYGLPHVYRNAVDWRTAQLPGWTWIANGPVNMPMHGDLVVWGEDGGVGTGPNGHIAICLAASPMHMVSFDQNWPKGDPCRLHLHGYGGVMGWLHPSPMAHW